MFTVNIKQISLWITIIIWAYFIYFVSSISGQSTIMNSATTNLLAGHALEWAYHFSAFGILSLLLCFAINIENKLYVCKRSLIVLIIAVSYSITDEWHQSMVAYRTASLGDLLIDSIGCVSAITVAKLIRFKLSFNSQYDK
jgi:hypothetical protein